MDVVLLLVGPGGPGAPLQPRQSPDGTHLGAGLAGAGVELTADHGAQPQRVLTRQGLED